MHKKLSLTMDKCFTLKVSKHINFPIDTCIQLALILPFVDRDQYTPSWLKTTETRGKSPSTPNLAFCTPSKDTGEIPQWKKELAEKRKGRKDSDLGFTVIIFFSTLKI